MGYTRAAAEPAQKAAPADQQYPEWMLETAGVEHEPEADES
jgi:hypothetical protein